MNTIQMYDAQADTIKMEDISNDDNSRVILHRIKRNDANDKINLFIQDYVVKNGETDIDIDYKPEGAKDMGWLGYFIGENTNLKTLCMSQFEGYGLTPLRHFFQRS